MTTTIAPGIGHAPLWTQQGFGATGYDAVDRRRGDSVGLAEGVLATGAFAVSQRAAGANMTVDVAASTGDPASGIAAIVQGDALAAQGLYPVAVHTAVINEAIGANGTGQPRNDLVVLEIQDNFHDSSGGNLARTRVIAGTATAGAAKTDALGVNGTPSLPSSAIPLAVVNVPSGAGSITNSNIDDRRPLSGRQFVTALPPSPYDGQEIYYQADATNGINWHLRYRAASGSAYKWEVLGAGALMIEPGGGGIGNTSNVYSDITGGAITAPLAGEYEVAYSAQVGYVSGSSGNIFLGVKIGSGTVTDQLAAAVSGTVTPLTLARTPVKRTVTPASTIVKLQYASNTITTGNLANLGMSLRPIRVG